MQVFFPVAKDGHYYVICFDLNNGSTHILDNSASKITNDKKYGVVPTTVVSILLNITVKYTLIL